MGEARALFRGASGALQQVGLAGKYNTYRAAGKAHSERASHSERYFNNLETRVVYLQRHNAPAHEDEHSLLPEKESF